MCSSHITGGVNAASVCRVRHRWRCAAHAAYSNTPEPGRFDMLLMHRLTEEQISQLRSCCIHRHRLNRNTNRIQFSWSSGAPRRPSGPTQISLTEHTFTGGRTMNAAHPATVSSRLTNQRRQWKLVPLRLRSHL